MEKLFKIPMLKIMYQARAEELEKYINNSNDNKNKLNDMEQKIKAILNYIPGEHYNAIESEMDNILMEIQEYANYWNEHFYRCAVVDTVRANEEIKQEMEKCNGKIYE